jgi:Ca2+-dependent lipid-binding protein
MSSSRFVVGFVAGAAASLSLVYALSYYNAKREDDEEELPPRGNESGSGADDDLRGNGKHSSKGRNHLPSAADLEKLLHLGSRGTDKSTVSFFSDLIGELWDHIDMFLSSMIRETVEPTLATTLPAPLNSLKFTKLSLGQVPIRLENVAVAHRSHQSGEQLRRSDSPAPVKVYMDVAWHARCDIRLEGAMGIALGVEQISLHGKLACLVHPTTASPIVSAVNVSFVNVPTIDLNFTGLAAVADVQMIKRKVIQSVQQSMADVMVLPNSMAVRVDPAARFVDLYNPPRGILRLTLVSGKGFQVERRLMFGKDDVVDVYCVLSLGSKTWTSTTVDNCLNPTWNETVDFLYHDPEQILTIHAWDRDQGALDSDDHLGVVFVKVHEALGASNDEAMHVELFKSASDATKTGIILALSFESVVLTRECSSVATSTVEPNRVRGVLEVLVVGARDLPVSKSSASTYVKVKVGAREFVTCTVADAPGVDALNPQYDGGFVIALQSPEDLNDDVVLTLYNGQRAIGSHSVPIRSLLDVVADPSTVNRAALGKSGGTLEFCAWVRGTKEVYGGKSRPDESRLPPANRSSAPSPSRQSQAQQSNRSSTASTSEPNLPTPTRTSTIPRSIVTRRQAIGKVRVTVVKGFGFKPHRGFFRRLDVPSVYCQLFVAGASDDEGADGNDERGANPWKTNAVRNSVNPVWDESCVLPFFDERDMIAIRVCDEDRAHLGDGDDWIGDGRMSIRSAVAYCCPNSSKKQRRPIDVTISRKGKGTVAFIAIVVEKI